MPTKEIIYLKKEKCDYCQQYWPINMLKNIKEKNICSICDRHINREFCIKKN